MATSVSAGAFDRGPREYRSDLNGAGRSRFCRFWARGLLIAMSGGSRKQTGASASPAGTLNGSAASVHARPAYAQPLNES